MSYKGVVKDVVRHDCTSMGVAFSVQRFITRNRVGVAVVITYAICLLCVVLAIMRYTFH